jgi:hypothetical protein
MPKSSNSDKLVGLLITVIVILSAIFYALFSPETPTSPTPLSNTTIPLGNVPAGSKAGDIQGTVQSQNQSSVNLQQAAPLSPDQLNSVSL